MKSPKIRFKKFQNEWNSTTLGELNIEMLKGSGISKNDLKSNGQIPCIHYGELFTFYKELITQIKHKTDFGSVFSKINDVLMPTSDVTPNGLAKASCIKFDNIALSGDILILRCCNKIDGLFLAYIIRFNQKQILQLVSGTTVYHIYAKDMINFKFYLPTDRKEQEAIGEFFRKIDEILDLEKLRFKKFENFKKTMLDNLFVASGENTPRLRLGYFTSEWNSTTLGELNIEMLKGSGISKNDLKSNGQIPCIHYGELFTFYKELITQIKHKTDFGSVFSKINDVLMPTSDVTPNGLAKASCIKFDNIALSGDILILRCCNKIDGLFLAYIIRFNQKQILQLVSGTTVYHIYAKDMINFKFYLPTDRKEQEAIGEFFRKIDEILELSQNRISKLENIKKYLLNKMFV